MVLRERKTKVMVCGTSHGVKGQPNFEIKLNDVSLQQVTSYKYLGVVLDSHLKFDKHVQKTLTSATGKLNQFRCMRTFLNEKRRCLFTKICCYL